MTIVPLYKTRGLVLTRRCSYDPSNLENLLATRQAYVAEAQTRW